MVIYHAITTYHIFKFCIHKLRYHKNDKALLLVPNFLLRKPSGVIAPSLSGIFADIYFFNWERKKVDSEQTIIKFVDKEMASALKSTSLSEITEVNVARAAYMFSTWLIHNKISFQWFEEADGRLSQPEPIMNDDKRIFPLRYELAQKNRMYTGDNPYVARKFIRMESQTPGFHDPMAVDFDPVREMKLLAPDDQEKLLQFFDVPRNLDFKANCVLMMTQHFSNLNILSYMDHALCYQLTADYYLEGYEAYYKWHPSDLMPYSSFMEKVHMIDGQFPTELLTLMVKEPFEIGASINSTGILNLKSICRRILTFNQDYLHTFWHNHQYYFAIKLMELFPFYETAAIGMNQIQLENMRGFSGTDIAGKIFFQETLSQSDFGRSGRIYLIGRVQRELMEFIEKHYEQLIPGNIFVFLNLYDEYECYPLMKEHPFTVKEIHINDLGSHCLRPFLDCRRMILFTSDQSQRERIETMKYTKRLLNTGAETVVFESMDKDIQIAALNGMLKATEAELLKYTEENAQLKERLKNH